jgi:hypothetical protein
MSRMPTPCSAIPKPAAERKYMFKLNRAAAITGHASLKELQRYIETRDRKKAARPAMGKLISRTEVANTNISLANQEKKAICPS